MANNTYDSENDGMLSGGEILTGFVSGLTFKNKPVQYTIVDGLAIFEGDIILGSAEEVASRKRSILAGVGGEFLFMQQSESEKVRCSVIPRNSYQVLRVEVGGHR